MCRPNTFLWEVIPAKFKSNTLSGINPKDEIPPT